MEKPAILLVDDEEDLVMVLGMMLGKDFQVTTASGPDDALSKLQNQVYSLILTDLNMPGTGTRSFVAELKQVAKDASIVCMSGYGPEHELFVKAQQAGALGLIRKPFGSSGELIAQLKQYLQTKS